jgi:hypothetical protein
MYNTLPRCQDPYRQHDGAQENGIDPHEGGLRHLHDVERRVRGKQPGQVRGQPDAEVPKCRPRAAVRCVKGRAGQCSVRSRLSNVRAK